MTNEQSHKLLNSLLELSNTIIEHGGLLGELQFNPTFYFTIGKDQVEEVARALAPVRKQYSEGYLAIYKEFPFFNLRFSLGERVCTVKAVKKVWVGERPAEEGYYREVYEYDCPPNPLLTPEGGDDVDPGTV